MYTPWLIPEGHEYQYDLGWLVRKLLSFETELNTAIDLKTIHYADPLQWDITTQYSPNTVVVDPKTGTAYMSKVPVPAGVQLTNTDYWVVVFNYQRIYDKIMSGVAFNDKDNLEASKDIQKYDFVWFGGDLYQAKRELPQGSKYIPNVNIVSATIADALAAYYGDARTASITNDTVTVAETQTITAKNRVISVTGDQTVNAGDIAETSANRTIKTTADYHIDVDGNKSDHIDGVTTKNYGGAVTATYGSSLDVGVTGTFTAEYTGGVTETYNGKRNVTVKDTTLTASGIVTASANQFDLTSTAKTFPVRFPDKTVDLYQIDATEYVTVKEFGAKGDGVTDDTAAFKQALQAGTAIFVPIGNYVITEKIQLTEYQSIIGMNPTPIGNVNILCRGGADTSVGFVMTRYNTLSNMHIIGTNIGTAIQMATSTLDCHLCSVKNVKITGFANGMYCGKNHIWDVSIYDTRIDDCQTAINFSDAIGSIFSITMLNVMTSGCNVIFNGIAASITFIGCNFGIIQELAFQSSIGCRLTFINCNFECDKHVTGTNELFRAEGETYIFSHCTFRANTDAAVAFIQTYTNVTMLKLEACAYSDATGGGNQMAEFFSRACKAYKFGSIIVGHGCYTIPRPNPYTAYLPIFLNEDDNLGIQYGEAITDTSKLVDGCLLYNVTEHKQYYYNGTSIVPITQ